jgi:hypothetical protein
MSTESPKNPRPDELPEDQRTGDEPSPSGKGQPRKAPSAPAIARQGHDAT